MSGIALITQSWRLSLDNWPCAGEPWWDGVRQGHIGEIRSNRRAASVILPRYPLQDVDSIEVDGAAVVVDDVFTVDTYQKPGRLTLKAGQALPVTVENSNGIQIVYTAGFGDSAADVPAGLKVGLLQMIASLYANRGDGCSVVDAYKASGAAAAFNAYLVRGL
jgi:uncharacterized phiE125 gp8 family phage protein